MHTRPWVVESDDSEARWPELDTAARSEQLIGVAVGQWSEGCVQDLKVDTLYSPELMGFASRELDGDDDFAHLFTPRGDSHPPGDRVRIRKRVDDLKPVKVTLLQRALELGVPALSRGAAGMVPP